MGGRKKKKDFQLQISRLLLVFCPLLFTQNCPRQAALLPLFVWRIPVPVLDLCQMQYYLSLISQVNLIIKKKKKEKER